jgi:hypothetical protein
MRSTPPGVIASEAKQSRTGAAALDSFATLAMTIIGVFKGYSFLICAYLRHLRHLRLRFIYPQMTQMSTDKQVFIEANALI